MRLGLALYGDWETISGGFLYDRLLVRYLREQGHAVEVVSLPWYSYPRGLLANFDLRLKRRLAQARWDALIQDELSHPAFFLLNRFLKKRASYPLVALVHSLRSCEPWPPRQQQCYRWVEKQYLETVDGIIVNSRATGTAVEDLVGRGLPSVLAYPGGDQLPRDSRPTPEEVAARVQAPGPVRLLFLANLIPRKGLHILLEALGRLSSPDWRLTVAGSVDLDSAYASGMLERLRSSGWRDRVEMVGPLRGRDLRDVLARSHLLVVPSLYEAFGIVYLEGMSFGLPAVATSAGGPPEFIRDGEDGFLIPPGDPAALSTCLSRLVGDRRLLLAMSLHALKNSATHPTWSGCGARILNFLQGLVA